jgi:hypothetical protein
VWLAFGALFIKQLIGSSDEETVEQIRENAYLTSWYAPRIAPKLLAWYVNATPFMERNAIQSQMAALHAPPLPPRSGMTMRAMSKRADLASVENEPEAR